MEQKWIHCESTILQWNKWKIIRSCQLCKTWCTPGNAFFHTVSPSLPRPLGVTNSVDTFWVWESGPPCSWASGSSSRNSAHKKATCLGDAGLLRKERGPWGIRPPGRDRFLHKGRKMKALLCPGRVRQFRKVGITLPPGWTSLSFWAQNETQK